MIFCKSEDIVRRDYFAIATAIPKYLYENKLWLGPEKNTTIQQPVAIKFKTSVKCITGRRCHHVLNMQPK